jgi:hypothetical protein
VPKNIVADEERKSNLTLAFKTNFTNMCYHLRRTLCACGRDGERERETHTQTDKDIHTERERHKYIERKTDIQREIERQTYRER